MDIWGGLTGYFEEQWDNVVDKAEAALPALKVQGIDGIINFLSEEQKKAQTQLEQQMIDGLNSGVGGKSAVKDSFINALVSVYGIYALAVILLVMFILLRKG